MYYDMFQLQIGLENTGSFGIDMRIYEKRYKMGTEMFGMDR